MSLFEAFFEPCILLNRERVPDGLGGFKTEWTDGAAFDAAIIKNTSLAASVAEKQGVTEVYTVTTPVGVGLEYHDAFRRVRDGETFRATTNAADTKPPETASFAFEQVKAERWALP